MKFVIDQPVSPMLAEWLRGEGHDAFHLRERGLSRLSDREVFDLATVESRVIVTSDLDYSRILALSGKDAPGLVVFRAGNISDDRMLALLNIVFKQVDPAKLASSVTVVDAHKIRIATLPLRPDLRD